MFVCVGRAVGTGIGVCVGGGGVCVAGLLGGAQSGVFLLQRERGRGGEGGGGEGVEMHFQTAHFDLVKVHSWSGGLINTDRSEGSHSAIHHTHRVDRPPV